MIYRNAIRCLNCNTEVESTHRHDFVTCACGDVSADGGHAYLKRSWMPGGKGFEELSSVSPDDYNAQFDSSMVVQPA